VWVPDDAGEGKARVSFSFAAWEAGKVVPSTVEIPIANAPAEGS
jgi:hypothetical protein